MWKQRNNMGRNPKIKQSQEHFWLDYGIECLLAYPHYANIQDFPNPLLDWKLKGLVPLLIVESDKSGTNLIFNSTISANISINILR